MATVYHRPSLRGSDQASSRVRKIQPTVGFSLDYRLRSLAYASIIRMARTSASLTVMYRVR